jgi:NAD(P)-dependent dehydrogenase (short-subunit alcohol dehydrogenase family)
MNTGSYDDNRAGADARPPRRPVALVTGASYGIGAAVAAGLARDGYDLAICDLDTATLAATRARIEQTSARVAALPLDLRRQDSIETALAAAIERLGAVDALVNNAGVPLPMPALEVTRADWETVMSVNLTGTFFMTQAVGRYLTKTKRAGAIVSVASSHGIVGAPGQTPYGVSKAAVIHMTRMLAIEWAGSGIRVNAVAPGKIETDSPARQANQIDPEKRARMMARIPVGRFGNAEEVAGLIRYLLTPQADYITGQTVIIDGGTTAQ